MKKLVLLACVGSAVLSSAVFASASTANWPEALAAVQDAAPEVPAPAEEPAASDSPTVEEPEVPSGPTVDQPEAPEGVSADEAPVVEPESPWEKWSVSFGGLFVATSSDVRFGAKGAGVEVNVEEALGLDTTTSSYRFEGAWRFSDNRRHRVGLSWVDLGRSGEVTTERDIDLGEGNVIFAGSGIRSGFQMNLIRTDYSYSFVQDDRVDLAATFGLYVAPIDINIETTFGAAVQDSFNVTAPLPLIGLRMDFLVAPKWYLRSNFSLFYLEYDGYKGTMSDVMLAMEYRAFEHFSVGLGVDNFRLAVEASGETDIPGVDALGQVDYGYAGLMLYVKGLW